MSVFINKTQTFFVYLTHEQITRHILLWNFIHEVKLYNSVD